MSVIELDLYEEDDPNGTSVGTITDADAVSIAIRIARRELGGGEIVLPASSTKAALMVPGRYVKVRIPSIQTAPIFGFTLSDGDEGILEADGPEEIGLGGPGPLFILRKGRLLEDPYATGQTARGSSDHDGVWWWIDEPYGAMLTRAIEEGQEEPGNPLGDVTIDFDRDADSDSVAWPNVDLEWETPIGSDVLSVHEALRKAGDLTVVGRPDLLIQAFQTYGRDLTGASFGAGVVRITEANLATELRRTMRVRRGLTHVIVEGKDHVYVTRTLAGWSGGAHWGYVSYPESNDTTVLAAVGDEALAAEDAAADALELEITAGFDEANGRYMPGEAGSNGHVWPGDTVTVNVGSIDRDALVAAIRIETRAASDDTSSDTSARSLRLVLELDSEGSDPGADPGPGVLGGDHGSPGHNPHGCCAEPAPGPGVGTPGTDIACWDFEDGDQLDTNDTYSMVMNLEEGPDHASPSGNCPANGGQWCVYNTAGRYQSQALPVTGDESYTLELDVRWKYNPSIRDIRINWFQGGSSIGYTVVFVGAGHSTGVDYHLVGSFTAPTNATAGKIDVTRYSGVFIDNICFSETSLPAPDVPYSLDDGGESPYFARSDDPRFDAVDQHETTLISLTMTNASGGDLLAGNIVVPSQGTAANEFTTTTTPADSSGRIGILLEDVADGEAGRVAWEGMGQFAPIVEGGTPNAGDYLYASATAGEVALDASRSEGAFGRVVSVEDDDIGTVELWGETDSASSGGGGGGGGGSDRHDFATIPGLRPPDSPSPGDIEFLEHANDTDPTAAPGMSWGNQGSATAVVKNGRLIMDSATTSGLRALMVAPPGSGSFDLDVALTALQYQSSHFAGIVMLWGTPGTPTAIRAVGRYWNGSVATRTRFVWSTYNTSWAATADVATADLPIGQAPAFLRIEWDGTNLVFLVSASGLPGTFAQITSQALGLGRPDYVGVAVNTNSASAASVAAFHHMRFDWEADFDPTTDGIVRGDTTGAEVRKTATQSIPGSTWTPISWDAEEYDDAGHWSSAAPTRITFEEAGRYLVLPNLIFASNSTGNRLWRAIRNGDQARELAEDSIDAPPGFQARISGSLIVNAAAGDYIEIEAFQDSGGNLNLDSGSGSVGDDAETTRCFVARLPGVVDEDGQRSGVSLTKSSTQTLTTATATAVTFDGEEFDTDDWHDNATNPSRITVTRDGYYLIGGTAEIGSHSGYVITTIRKNGSTILPGRGRGFVSSNYASPQFVTLAYLQGGDYVELFAEHNAGSDRDVRSSADGTSLWAYFLSPATGGPGYASVQAVIDAGESEITTGVKHYLRIPYDCSIVRASLLADQAGDIVVDIWKDTYANYPPTDADSITASAPPTLASADKSEDATLTGWTLALAEGDVLALNVDSVSTVTRVTLELRVIRA